jgi:glycosyltransferase involved in cell wall biosynthesis
MPPVEALGLGLPTLTTKATALPETTLGVAHTVDDPLDAEEWADKIMTILRSPGCYRPSPADVARIRAFYDPARIADAYLAGLTS